MLPQNLSSKKRKLKSDVGGDVKGDAKGDAIFNGTFIHCTDHNYSKLLEEMGLGYIKRQLHQLKHSKVVVNVDVGSGGALNMTTLGLFGKSTQRRVVIGEEALDVLTTGEQIRSVTVMECDNTLITRIRRPSGEQIEVRQEFSPRGLRHTISMDNSSFAVVRYFKRVV
jgi:hypothetical protein